MSPRLSRLGCLLLSSACGADALPAASQQQELIDATADASHPWAVAVLATLPSSYRLCSGTVVSPHVVLTAAHCLDAHHIGASNATFYVYDDPVVSGVSANPSGPHFFPVTEVHPHPSYDDVRASMTSQPIDTLYDIGVVVTRDALPQTPVQMSRSAPKLFTRFTTVGYGRSVANDDNTSGARRAGDSQMTGFNGDLIVADGSPHGVCGGDSGGPSFAANGFIVGVHFGPQNATTCTGSQYDTSVHLYAASFVDPFINAADPGWLVIPDAGPDAATSGNGCGCGNTGPSWLILALAAVARAARRT